MEPTTISSLFNNIIIHNKLRSIRSVFQFNSDQSHILNYKPSYQRKYVWTDVKATYLIETILLHGEIPPIVVYIKGKDWEVIDGRQRCESIERYIRNEFSLKPHGLEKLWNLAGKKFSQLDETMKERILSTSLRLIQVTATNEALVSPYDEEVIKREIFKRYNLGISPLKKEEVFKAQYIQDEINIYFKTQFEKKPELYKLVTTLFAHKSKNQETILQHIRELLVLQHIPINKYRHEREDIVNMYYDYLSYSMTGSAKKISIIFDKFREKCDYLTEISAGLKKANHPSNGLIHDCIFWGLSVCEKENVPSNEINNIIFKERLVNHIQKQSQHYTMDQSNHWQLIIKRYTTISTFFVSQLDISFIKYLKSDETFLVDHKDKMQKYMEERFTPGKELEHFSKMDPTSTSVSDILDRMKRRKFKLKPPYQRNEVMNISKASSLIESILLGIKIHPLYIYQRANGIAEVIDGQQRLLTILGFLGEKYADEQGKMVKSQKHQFALNLRTGLLPDLHRKKFQHLSAKEQSYIKDYDLEVIEIKEENNKHFLPEELFKRINHKPIPIKENTFEFWNAYVDRDITDAIKDLCKRNSWLYLRKDDKRMLNEELVTNLSYLHYMTSGKANMANIKEVLDISKRLSATIVKFRKKAHITQMLEDKNFKSEFLLSLNDFEAEFIEKAKLLISKPTGKPAETPSNKRLDEILHTRNVRMPMNFYLFWVILKGIPLDYIKEAKTAALYKVTKIFSTLGSYDTSEQLEKAIKDLWAATPALALS
ncbi:Protein of unknown function DUF262 [Chitinophaga eiseniae]|uniref:GmrSD restriction endonucleases N-terminal domain-containing protein n=1 Tax=Chitinophaga eiseniae TaxID=634771 RepID=A0A1T4NAK3_9BACT|nr:DUF262 domain-containing protein [Chitinophaga eiseniae]SJZ76135.1 Protein of unknown function DUF262 [Chitinophaga eiseniae]